jgi:hypothetical protein
MKRVSLSLFTVVLAATMTGADAVVELPPAEGVTEWVAGGADLATKPLSIDLTNQQALTFEKSSLTLKEMSPGSNLTDIGLWQVQSNGAFSIQIGAGKATAADGYTPPDYPAFTKADKNAIGKTVTGKYDELPATFSLSIENIESVCIGKSCNGLAITYSDVDKKATWGPKSGADFKKDLNNSKEDLLTVQVLDENSVVETAKVKILLQAQIPNLVKDATIQPGIYTANIKITVAATQKVAGQ